MFEVYLVHCLERVFLASIKTSGEFNSRVGARAEVESGALDLCGSCSIASGLLGIAVTYVGSSKGFRVGSIRAGGILDSA